jgi:hypothetical protein
MSVRGSDAATCNEVETPCEVVEEGACEVLETLPSRIPMSRKRAAVVLTVLAQWTVFAPTESRRIKYGESVRVSK